MGAGEQAGNWGNTTNYNLGTLLEQAIAGVENVTISGTSYTLTTGSGVADQARNAVINLTGTLSANCNVIVPSVDKVYTIRNSTTGGFSVVVKTAAGSGVTVANGLTQSMYCDATNVVASTVAFNNATNTIASNVTGNLTGNVTGNVSFGAGSAGSPGLSVTGDSDTGIFSPGANVLSVAVGGDRLMDFYQSTSILQNKLGDAEANYWVRLGDASAVNVRACQYGALNESSIPVASVRPVLATDGSSNIELYATPAGSRASDRRVLRMNVPGSGQITMNGGLGLNAGTAAAPAYSFSSDTNTGIFSPGADQLAFSLGGVNFVTMLGSAIGFGIANPGYPVTIQANASTGALRLVGRVADDISTMEFGNSTQSTTNAIIQSGPGYLSFGPSGTEQARVENTGAFRFNSGYGSVATAFGCRAWVNFNGTGTVAIRASGNVSSITDNGLADYTVNLTTPMPDANGSVTVGAWASLQSNSQAYADMRVTNIAASSFRLEGTSSVSDPAIVCAALHR
jgi:hypothetical protein